MCSEELSVDLAGDEVRLGFRWIHAAEPLPPLLVEVVFAAVLDLVWRGSGQRLAPRRVELSRRRADEALLGRHLGEREIVLQVPVPLASGADAELAVVLQNLRLHVVAIGRDEAKPCNAGLFQYFVERQH